MSTNYFPAPTSDTETTIRCGPNPQIHSSHCSKKDKSLQRQEGYTINAKLEDLCLHRQRGRPLVEMIALLGVGKDPQKR